MYVSIHFQNEAEAEEKTMKKIYVPVNGPGEAPTKKICKNKQQIRTDGRTGEQTNDIG